MQIFEMLLLANIAILLKQNYLIFLLAMVVLLIIDFFCSRCLRSLLCAGALFVTALLCSAVVVEITTAMSGMPVSDGMPKTAWIMMGLQESPRAPGWYNGNTVGLYQEFGYDAIKTDNAARLAIAERLQTFSGDHHYALQFFGKKIASEWNEPTFQCFWISSVRDSYNESPPYIKSVLAGPISLILEQFLRIFNFFVLLGTLCFICFPRKKITIGSLLFAIAFIGGFLFHVIWEAKAEYTFQFLTLPIHYAVEGAPVQQPGYKTFRI